MYIYNNIENTFIYFKVYLFYNLANLLHVIICVTICLNVGKKSEVSSKKVVAFHGWDKISQLMWLTYKMYNSSTSLYRETL